MEHKRFFHINPSTAMQISKVVVLMFAFAFNLVWGQANIPGNAAITLVDGGTDCNGSVRLVEVHANVSGLSGDGGLAGINAFLLQFHFDEGTLFSTVRKVSGSNSFDVVHTEKALVGDQNFVIVSGWDPNPNAPNGNYHLATIQFAGLATNVSITVDASGKLASRVVGGFGPDEIAIQAPSPATFSVPTPIPFTTLEALPFWLAQSALYDLVPSGGQIDMLDLVKLVICTE